LQVGLAAYISVSGAVQTSYTCSYPGFYHHPANTSFLKVLSHLPCHYYTFVGLLANSLWPLQRKMPQPLHLHQSRQSNPKQQQSAAQSLSKNSFPFSVVGTKEQTASSPHQNARALPTPSF
jgi:hypothetical protein